MSELQSPVEEQNYQQVKSQMVGTKTSTVPKLPAKAELCTGTVNRVQRFTNREADVK